MCLAAERNSSPFFQLFGLIHCLKLVLVVMQLAKTFSPACSLLLLLTMKLWSLCRCVSTRASLGKWRCPATLLR